MHAFQMANVSNSHWNEDARTRLRHMAGKLIFNPAKELTYTAVFGLRVVHSNSSKGKCNS